MVLISFLCIVCGFLVQNFEAATIGELYVTEAPACSPEEFRCQDDTCVAGLSRCNGTAECPDRSDETFVLCRNERCSQDQFRCAYGACVTGAPCDGIQHCMDNSDELLTRCIPETDRIICDTSWSKSSDLLFSCRIPTDCDNGQWIAEKDKCDGKVDCEDASDETIAHCAEVKCADDTFRCAYGSCVHKRAKCDGVVDCADGSDESDQLCDRVGGTQGVQLIDEIREEHTTHGPLYEECILPPQPENGAYHSYDAPKMSPNDNSVAILLNYTCGKGYKLAGKPLIYCREGMWSDEFPSCNAYCILPKDQSVEYRCLLSGQQSVEGYRECNYEEPSGTRVKPVCKAPNYYYPRTLDIMHCNDGNWDYVAMCLPECGRMSPKGISLIAGGRPADLDEVPWHAGIYSKTRTPYEQICGGSIISTKVIISAAHCFWNGTLLPAYNYAVAVGKLNRTWYDPEEDYVQHRDVLDIKIPARFRGEETSFQDDIALVVLKKGLQYSIHVRPICLDFDYEFDVQQLQPGNLGKVAGWGYTSANGEPSPFLKVTELPYISIDQCLEETPFGFKSYVTSDKICAGYRNGTAVCKGDSGGGLSFPAVEREVTRYYLRGLVSTAPKDDQICNTHTITTFTHVWHHQNFIKDHFETFSVTGFRYLDVRMLSNYNGNW